MKKYLLTLLFVLFAAVTLPAAADAASRPDALTATDMAGAQAVSIGSSESVDLTTADMKIYRLGVAANQAYRFDEADSLDISGNVSYILYDVNGQYKWYLDDGELIVSETATTYYILAYTSSLGESSFAIKDGMFTDNVDQKRSDGNEFGFVPSTTGTYAFSTNAKATLNISGSDIADISGNGTAAVSATLTAGKYYTIYAGSYNGKVTITLTKSPASDAVIAQINSIGTVTSASGSAIDAARAAYNALTAAEQKAVSNIATLDAAEKAYADATKPSVSKVKVKSAKSTKKKTATIKWKKVSGANGYEVTYSLKKSLKKATTVTVASSKAKTVLKKLKSGKTYYVKVRAYKTYRGQTYYGSYSKVKKVKVK